MRGKRGKRKGGMEERGCDRIGEQRRKRSERRKRVVRVRGCEEMGGVKRSIKRKKGEERETDEEVKGGGV